MNKTIFLGLTIGVIAVAMITLAAASVLDFIVMGKVIDLKCTKSFFHQTCCWINDEDGSKTCLTCLDDGRGGWFDCKSTTTPASKADPFIPPKGGIFQQGDTLPTPGPAQDTTPKGGILQGDIIPTPGPAEGGIFQPQQGPATQDMPRSGIFQGNLLESYSQQGLVQSDPEAETPTETNTTQPGGIFREDLEQLGATQDNETTSQEGLTQEPPASEQNMTAVPPASEETQPALVQEEPMPQCPEGQILDEETNLCVPEEPEADEPEQEEQEQPQPEEAEEEPTSEEGDEN